MESVIAEQKISRRRKPVRIVRLNGDKRFHLDKLKYGSLVTQVMDQQVIRFKTPSPDVAATTGAPSEPDTARGRKKIWRLSSFRKLRLSRQAYIVPGILLCIALAILGLSVLPSLEMPVDMSGFILPPADEINSLLLHGVIDRAIQEEEVLNAPPLPLTLTLHNYTITKNATLDAIARRFNISLDTLISINGISDVRRLQVGATLKVPNIDGITYTVQRGDNLSSIANRNNTSILDIVDANDLVSHTISPGQILFIPGARLSSYDLKKALGTLVSWPVTGRISSNFGYRSNPFTGIRQFHSGLDIVAPLNSDVVAAMDGRVAETGYSSIFGNFVIMTHAGSYQTLYAHLNRIKVKAGQALSQGGTVGLLGSTGYSTGPHLHFGVYKSGTAMDPLRLLRGN